MAQVAPLTLPGAQRASPICDATPVDTQSTRTASSLQHFQQCLRSHVFQGKVDAIVVELERRTLVICWILLVLARSICIAYCLGAARSMLVLHRPSMSYYAELLQPGLRPLLPPMAALYAAVAVAHALHIARMVSLAMRSSSTKSQSVVTAVVPSQCMGVFHRMWRPLFSRRGFFGVESKYYEARYVFRETVEIISQSVQAYTSSVLIGSLWINNVYIAIVVLNCFSTPLIQRLTRRFHWSMAQERLACVVVDTVLDAGTAIVLPAVLVYPYIRDLDLERHTFPIELLYNDVWFIGLTNENRQVFPLSVVDLALKFSPQVSLLLSISSIKSILRLRTETRGQPTKPSPVVGVAPPPLQSNTRRLSKLHSFFVVWGLGLLLSHMVAVTQRHPNEHREMDGCKQQLRPWFVLKSACSVYNFNCFRRETDSMDVAALNFLDAKSLAVLVIMHCPALRVSPSIGRFANLIGLEIYNSTLVEWSESAALTSASHPAIAYVFIVRTNLTAIPPGLLSPDMPPTLMDIEFSATNLARVPPDLHETWSRVSSLYIELSQFQAIPATVLQMQLDDFSAIGNNITQLPDFSTSQGAYIMMALAENPFNALPPSMGDLNQVNILNLIGTNLSTLPDWMDSYADSLTRVYLADTPFCAAKSAEDIEKNYGFNAKMSCLYTDGRVRSRYPLSMREPFLAP